MAVNQTPTNSTLAAIKNKIRLITRSPDTDQLTESALEQYINTAILYEFPETLRLFNLRRNFTFYTQPNVDVYESNTTNPDDPLYDFTNRYITIHPPVYVGGIQIQFTQSQQQFFSYWPENQYMTTVGNGDGVTTAFSGTLSTFPVLRNEVNFTSIDALGNGMVLYDIPVPGETLTGNLFVSGNNALAGVINYITGQFNISFPNPPDTNIPVRCQAWPYRPAIPTIMLFFDGKFTLRPVPDQSYRVQMEVFVQPTQLLTDSQVPELSEWWEFISYLAARKIFEDRMDNNSIAEIQPHLNRYEKLVLRRTLVQQSNERATTIYNYGSSNSPFNWGNNYWGTF